MICMKKTFIAVVLPFILLAGCSDDEQMFKGESTSWKGEVFVQEVNEEQQLTYTFTYIGDDLAEQINKSYTLSFESPKIEHTRHDVLSEDGMIAVASPSSCANCLQDGELNANVTITLDGQTEKIVFSDY